MIEEVAKAGADPAWKAAAYQVAEQDYRSYWMHADAKSAGFASVRNDRNPVYHFIEEVGGNRYCDVHLNHATAEQADRMVREILPQFEQPWGLANTEAVHKQPFKQWDYPNGWPNLHWLVLDGMWRYGYTQEVRRIAEKWLSLNCTIRERTGDFWEKYDVVAGEVGKSAVYPTQSGFGWTLGVFVAMVQEFMR